MSRGHVAVGLALVLGAAGTAIAETQAEIASHENDEGKELMYAGKFDEATAKFRDAVARVPEPKYFFNLCTSMFQEGKFGEALTSCNSAGKALATAPDDKLKDKVDRLSQRIRDEAKAQGLDLQPVGGGGGDPNLPPPDASAGGPPPADPGNAGPATAPTNSPSGPSGPLGTSAPPTVQYQPIIGRPPEQSLFKAVLPDHSYLWTLGIDLFAGGANFQGQINGASAFGNASGGFRIKSDYMLSRRARVGVEGYVSYTTVTSNANAMTVPTFGELDILETGLGIYKHLCLRNVERLCLTPLLGAGLAFMDPNLVAGSMGTYNYLGASIRAEVAANFAFGRRYEHVLSVAVDFRYYTPAFSDPTDGSPPRSMVGLDDPGQIVTIGIGYTYRFNTPLGSRAFITLE